MSESGFLLVIDLAAILGGVSLAGAVEWCWLRWCDANPVDKPKVRKPVKPRKIVPDAARRRAVIYPDGKERFFR